MFEEVNHLKRKMTMNASVLNVQSLTPCPEHVQNGSSALSAINVPTTVVPNLATFMFVGNAILVTLMTSCLKTAVKCNLTTLQFSYITAIISLKK
jgi:hypothetical protein